MMSVGRPAMDCIRSHIAIRCEWPYNFEVGGEESVEQQQHSQ